MAMVCAAAAVCLTAPEAKAQTTWHVFATSSGAGGGLNMGMYQDQTNFSQNPADTFITVGDSVEADWQQSDCTNPALGGTETTDCDHSMTETTALGNSVTRTGGFDSGIQIFNFNTSSGFQNKFVVGPATLTLTGGFAGDNNYFYECFVHGPPMEGQIIVRGLATHLVLSAPASVTAGTAFSVTVTAEDSNNNKSPGYIHQVTFSGGGTGATLPAAHTFNAGTSSTDNGQHTYTNAVTLTQAGLRTITATDSSNGAVNGSANITVVAKTANHLVVSAAPGSVVAGNNVTVTVTAEDQFNNVDANDNDNVTLTSSDGQAVFPGSPHLTSGVGTFSVTLKSAGSQTVSASTPAGPRAILGVTASNAVTVAHATANHLVVSATTPVTAGNNTTATVTAKDAFGNTDTADNDLVSLSSSDPSAVVVTPTPQLTSGVGTFLVTLKTSGSQTVSAATSGPEAVIGTTSSNTITVNPAAATHFVVSAPGTANAGSAFSISVTAQDQFNNTATGYAGTVHFTSTDGQAILPANSTLTSGTKIFSVTLGTLGTQTITATDTISGSINGTSNSVTVSPGSATHFVVSAPASANAGNSFSFTVTAQDSFNNTATGYAGTVHFTSTDGQAVLPANSTLTSGAGTFNATLKTAGAQTVTATDTVTLTITGTSGAITVAPAAASSLQVSAPGSATAGTPFSVTVSARDAFNNVATTYVGTIHFTTTDTNAPILPANYTFVGGDNGSHIFTNGVTLKTSGGQTVSATDTITGSITGNSSTITVGSAPASTLIVSASPSSISAGNSVTVNVTAKDAFGNTDISDNDAVQFSSTDGQAVFPAGALVSGSGSFSVTLKTVGSQTVSIATAGPRSTIGATASSSVTVGPAAANQLVVSATTPVTAGNNTTVTVTAKDAFGNIDTADNDAVTLTSTDGQAVFPGSPHLTAGIGSFSVTLKTVGSRTVSASTAGPRSTIGTKASNFITVNPAAASHFQVTGPGSASAGSAFSVTVQAVDAFSNNTTVYSGTVHFTSNDGVANLPPDSTLTNGVGSFNVTLNTQGPKTVTATDTVTSSITGTLNLSVAPVCTAASKTFPTNPTAIQIPGGSAPANPYPSPITVPATGTAGGFASGQTVGSLTVTLNDFTYSNTSGLALLLVHRDSGRSFILMANAGNGASAATFTISDAGSGALPGTSPITNGIFTPTFLAGTYTGTSFASPAPLVPYALPSTQGSATLNGTFGGDDPGGEWDLYAEDFAGGQSGQIAGGWNLTITPQETTTAVTPNIPINFSVTAGFGGTAITNPYPSPLQVSGLPGNITHLTLTLNGLTWADCIADLSILLQGPAGQTFVPWSTVGNCASGSGMSNLTIVLDDSATLPLPEFSSVLTAGTFKPASYASTLFPTLQGTVFPSPAPAGPYLEAALDGSSTLGSVFNGTNPNGTWNLYLEEQPGLGPLADTGSVNSWSLTFQTDCPRATTCTLNPDTNPSLFGQPVTFSANVSSAAGTPDGSVDFDDDVTTLQSVTLDGSGNASASPISNLSVGSHNVQAVYGGNGATFQAPPPNDSIPFAACTSAAPAQVVNFDSSVTAVMTSGSPSTAGNSVTFTATVSSGFAGNPGPPTGSVTFENGASPLGAPVALSGGTAQFSTSSLPAGTLTINAVYSGDGVEFSGSSGNAQQIVNPASATQLVVSAAPSSITAGNSVTVTVTAKDAFGNVDTNDNDAVQLNSTDGQAVFPGSPQLTNGTGSFSVTLKTAGSQTVSVADSGHTIVAKASNSITVSPASATHFSVAAPASATAGTAFTVTVAAKDAFNNTATGYRGTVHFTSTDANSPVLPANYTFTAADNGIHTFTNQATLKTSGTQKITATDTVTATITGASAGIAVSAAAASKFVVTAPASSTAGVAFTVTVTAQDQFNNTATGYRGTVQFTSTDGNSPLLPANYIFTAADNGVHTFTNGATLKTSGSQTITATDTVSAAIHGTSSTIAVAAAAAASYSLTGPGSTVAGIGITVTITAKDAFGNTATSYNGTANLTKTDAAAVMPASVVLASGVTTFGVTFKTAGAQSVTAHDSVSGTITGSINVTVTPAAATQLVLTAPASATAGVSFSATVTAKDPFGNVDTNFIHTVHFASSDPSSPTLPADYGFTSGDAGVHTFAGVVLKTAPSQTITVSDMTNPAVTSSIATVTVNPAAATKLAVSAPANATAGTAFTVTITAQDQFSNAATGYRGTVHFTTTDTNAPVLPANYIFTAADNGVHAFASGFTLKAAGSKTVTATDTVTGSINGTSGAIVVAAAAASRFNVAAPANATAGLAFSVTVTAFDPFNNVANGYRGSVSFSGTDAQEIVPANYTFTAADNGAHSFATAVTLKTTGSQTVTVTDTVTNTISGTSGAIAVGSAAATQLLISAPTSTTAGAGFTATVTAKDAFGNIATGFSDTVQFTSSDGQVSASNGLPANYAFTGADAGVHTFTGVTLKTAGAQTLHVADSSNGAVTGATANITVSPAATSKLVFTSAPASATAGVSFGVAVAAKDAFNNVTPGFVDTVHFASTDAAVGAGSGLPANYTFIGADAGAHIFAGVTLKTSGTQSLTVSDATSGTITSANANITVSPAAVSQLVLSAPTLSGNPPNSKAGNTFVLVVTAQDAFANTVTSYAGSVHFTSTDAQAALPADYTFVVSDSGSHVFTATLKTVGSRTITSTDKSNGAIKGTITINVTPASTSKFKVTAPASASVGAALSFTVTAQDNFGNTTTGYAGTVQFSSSDGAAQLPANSTLVSGTGSFNATLLSSGNQTLTATDAVATGITGTSAAINVAKANSNVGVAPSITIAYFQHPAILAVTVTNSSGSGTPTGTVHLLDNGVQVPGASVALDGSGQASFSTLGLRFGDHVLSVAYDGDGNFNAKTSVAIPIRITPGVRPLP